MNGFSDKCDDIILRSLCLGTTQPLASVGEYFHEEEEGEEQGENVTQPHEGSKQTMGLLLQWQQLHALVYQLMHCTLKTTGSKIHYFLTARS